MTNELVAGLPVVFTEIELVVVQAGGDGYEDGLDLNIGLDIVEIQKVMEDCGGHGAG